MGIPILSPDVNEAGKTFVGTAKGIRFAMSGIKGIGTGAVDAIIEERTKKGPFKSLYEFCKRIDTKRVGKKTIEDLVEAGCFDFTGWSRDALRQSVDPIFAAASQEQKEAAAGVMSLFALMGDTGEERYKKPPEVQNRRTKMEIWLKEKELMGFFLTGHPLNEYRDILGRLSCVPLEKIGDVATEAVFRCAFIVEAAQLRVSAKTQKKFAILTISDGIERFELPVWSDLYEEKHFLLKENQLLYAVLHVEKKEDEVRLSCKWLDDLSQADESMIEASDAAYDKAKFQSQRFAQQRAAAKKEPAAPQKQKAAEPKREEKMVVERNEAGPVRLIADAEKMTLSQILKLKHIFESHRGTQQVHVEFQVEGTPIGTLHIDSAWGVVLSDKFHADLREVAAVKHS
jgi:DNA polymerase-3 subunit alpha